MMRTSLRLLVPLLLLAFHVPATLAMGNDDSENKTPDCPKGQIYDSQSKSCVPEKISALSDTDKTNYAYHLAKKGEYQAAINLLDTLREPNTKEAWNYRGYATRKLGHTDEGIAYYQKSIALDPHYARVREYLGEAWMTKGRPEMAMQQLTIIKSICGVECEEYQDLKAAIQGNPES